MQNNDEIMFARPSLRGSFIRAPVSVGLPRRADLRRVSAARYSFCLNHDYQDSRISRICHAENGISTVGAYGIRPVSNRISPMYNFAHPPPPSPIVVKRDKVCLVFTKNTEVLRRGARLPFLFSGNSFSG
jgi:hypothetical protein